MPPNTLKVDRSTRYGNPFRVGEPGIPDVRTSVERFKAAMRSGELTRDDPDSPFRSLQGAGWVGIVLPLHALLCSSFPRKRESILFFVFPARSKASTRPAAERVTFLTPCILPCGYAGGLRGSLSALCSLRVPLREQSPAYAIPGYGARRGDMRFNACRLFRLAHVRQRTGAHPARHASGFSSARSPRHGGGVWAASCRRSNSKSQSLLRTCLAAVQGCADSWIRASYAVPRSRLG